MMSATKLTRGERAILAFRVAALFGVIGLGWAITGSLWHVFALFGAIGGLVIAIIVVERFVDAVFGE